MRGNRIVFAKQSQLKPVIKRHFSKGEFVKKLHFLGCWPTFLPFLPPSARLNNGHALKCIGLSGDVVHGLRYGSIAFLDEFNYIYK